MNKDNLTYAFTFTLSIVAKVVFLYGVFFMISNFSGWWILSIFLIGLVPTPQRHFKVNIEPSQIAEAFIGEIKRDPNKYKGLMQLR